MRREPANAGQLEKKNQQADQEQFKARAGSRDLSRRDLIHSASSVSWSSSSKGRRSKMKAGLGYKKENCKGNFPERADRNYSNIVDKSIKSSFILERVARASRRHSYAACEFHIQIQSLDLNLHLPT